MACSQKEERPKVVGLRDDPQVQRSKTWSWECSDSCTYRYIINQSSSYTFTDQPYILVKTATQATGDGKYWIHVQAKSTNGIESLVKSVSVTLDRTPPIQPQTSAFSISSSTHAATLVVTAVGFAKGDTIELYQNTSCTGTSTGHATVQDDQTPIQINIPDSPSRYYAKAIDMVGNQTSCSYIFNTTKPKVIGLIDDSNPTAIKTWRWGCNKGQCTYRYAINLNKNHTFLNSDIYDQTTSISQTSGDGTYYIHVQARDSIGNESLVKSVSAILNSKIVSPSALSVAKSPDNDRTPSITVTNVVPGDQVTLYHDSRCTKAQGSGTVPSGATSIVIQADSLPRDGLYNYYVKITNTTNNTQNCLADKVAYVLDTTPPSPPSRITVTPNTGNNPQPEVQIRSITPQNRIALYTEETCHDNYRVGSAVAQTTYIKITLDTPLTLKTTPYRLYARAEDPAGNFSHCSTSFASYTLTKPDAPNKLTLITPTPNNKHLYINRTPTIRVEGIQRNRKIQIYSQSNCTGKVLGESTSSNSISVDVTLSIALNKGTMYRLYARDGTYTSNPSNCSSMSIEYFTYHPLALGYEHSCYLFQNGEIKCWGANDSGQLGQGHINSFGDEASEINISLLSSVRLGSSRSVKAITAGGTHTCAILDNSQVKCWGSNEFGNLGLGHNSAIGDQANEMSNNLVYVSLGNGRTVKAISAGQWHTCAILDNDKVKCWGRNRNGQLGQGNAIDRGDQASEIGNNLAYTNLGTGRTAKAISAGGTHTCAILDNDTLKCWGNNQYGQLGQGHINNIGNNPNEMGNNLLAIDLGAGLTAKAISAGFEHTCVILNNDNVKCFGRNHFGQLGLGDTQDRGGASNEMGSQLLSVNLGTGRLAKAISAKGSHSCAILDNNELKCWGANDYGQLGQNDQDNRGDALNEMGIHLPYIDLGTKSQSTYLAKIIATGSHHTCTLLFISSTFINDVKCWGFNRYGQLGQGNTFPYGISNNTSVRNISPIQLE